MKEQILQKTPPPSDTKKALVKVFPSFGRSEGPYSPGYQVEWLEPPWNPGKHSTLAPIQRKGCVPYRIHGTGIFNYIYHKNQPNVSK